MSEKPHTSPSGFPRPVSRNSVYFALFLIVLFAFVYFFAHIGHTVLDALARHDPDAARQIRLDSLRATRALLLPPAQGGPQLWSARRSGAAAGVFLAGAVSAERLGQPAAARLWLAMDCLSRGDRDGASRLMKEAGTTLPPGATLNPRDPQTWENGPLGRALRQSIQAE